MTGCRFGTNLFERNDDDLKTLDPLCPRYSDDRYGRRSHSECDGESQWWGRCQGKFRRTCAKRGGEGW